MSFFESVLAFGFEPWLEILLALLLEIAFGKLLRFDPTDWIDRLSIRLHERTRHAAQLGPPTKELSRAVMAALLPALVLMLLTLGLITLIDALFGALWASVARILLLCFAFSFRRELWGASSVIRRLKKDDKEGARAALSRFTKKDTANMNAVGLVRTSAEECSRAVAEGGFFPLFYASLGTLCHLFGGPSLSAPLALGAVMAFSVCRAANATFDQRPLYQGLLVKMGSALAFMPQRLFSVLVMPAAFVLRLAWKQSLQTMAQGSLILPQFSRGWVMGALSGACGLKLGGGGYYGGNWQAAPSVGTDYGSPDTTYLRAVIVLDLLTLALASAVTIALPAAAAVCAIVLGFFAVRAPSRY